MTPFSRSSIVAIFCFAAVTWSFTSCAFSSSSWHDFQVNQEPVPAPAKMTPAKIRKILWWRCSSNLVAMGRIPPSGSGTRRLVGGRLRRRLRGRVLLRVLRRHVHLELELDLLGRLDVRVALVDLS